MKTEYTKLLPTAIVLLVLGWFVPQSAWTAAPGETCTTCHSNMEEKLAKPAKLFPGDIHAQAGLGCADCHGGDPKDDSLDAMSKAKGFRGKPTRAQIPEFCGRCHSDVNYMRRFNPKIRTDEASEYITSVHGKKLKQGDANVATCVSCHSVHDILAISDSRSPVHPTRVATTCGRCHSDAAMMKEYKIPTNQAENYQKSVHFKAITGGDLSAPTCSTCHGSHGATPPGVESVANVCGTCHVFFAQLYDKSPHKAAFTSMGFPGCVQCHSNHLIAQPSDEWAGVGPKAICITCHVDGDAGYAAASKIGAGIGSLKTSIERAESRLELAEQSGMEVSSAKLDLAAARESLVKSRVAVHSFNGVEVQKLTGQGVTIADKSFTAGVDALKERDYRRKGLGLALVFILITMAGIYMKIRHMESGK